MRQTYFTCGHCGQRVDESTVVCPHCGVSLRGIRCLCGFVGQKSDFIGGRCPKCGSFVSSLSVEEIFQAKRDFEDSQASAYGQTREQIQQAIGNMRDARNVEGLIKALNWKWNQVVREEAALALGKLRDLRSVEPLIAALTEGSSKARAAIVMALGQIGDARAEFALYSALGSLGGSVHLAAAEALKMLKP
jgi:hypothetical protein